MANRFSGEYRPPHSGTSPLSQGLSPFSQDGQYWREQSSPRRLTPELRLQSWSGEDEKGEFTQKGANKKYTFEKSKPKTKGDSERKGDYYAREPKKANDNSFRDNPPKDEGGSSILRNSKKPPKSPSGGMALPLPQKVK